jgi:hypothetical protein
MPKIMATLPPSLEPNFFLSAQRRAVQSVIFRLPLKKNKNRNTAFDTEAFRLRVMRAADFVRLLLASVEKTAKFPIVVISSFK